MGQGYSPKSFRCNHFDEFEQSGVLLHYLSTLVTSTTPTAMAAATYHRDPDIDDVEVSFFPGHIDKAFPRHFQVTITPKRTDGNKRDVFIFHPLDGIGHVTT